MFPFWFQKPSHLICKRVDLTLDYGHGLNIQATSTKSKRSLVVRIEKRHELLDWFACTTHLECLWRRGCETTPSATPPQPSFRLAALIEYELFCSPLLHVKISTLIAISRLTFPNSSMPTKTYHIRLQVACAEWLSPPKTCEMSNVWNKNRDVDHPRTICRAALPKMESQLA
jgi:hypothetical protein